MADQNTSLPVRSEADVDERLQTKIVDYTTPTQGMNVDTDGSAQVEIHTSDGAPVTDANPLPVYQANDPGTEVADYDVKSAIASDASDNHDYVVADGTTLELYGVLPSASGKAKFELIIGDGAALEAFTDTKCVTFNSTSMPNAPMHFEKPIVVTGTPDGRTVRLVKTNRDNQAQDLYSTLVGILK